MAPLVQLKLSDIRGLINREVVVAQAISMYNLHRALQFCIKPNQTDSTIDGKDFIFTHVASSLPVRGPKSTQLYRANPVTHDSEVHIGDSFMYEPAGGGKYLLDIVAIGYGDDTCYVPRCVSGNANLDVINKKLLVRRFTKTGAGQMKKPPKLWCSKGTPASDLWASHMAAMQDALV